MLCGKAIFCYMLIASLFLWLQRVPQREHSLSSNPNHGNQSVTPLVTMETGFGPNHVLPHIKGSVRVR